MPSRLAHLTAKLRGRSRAELWMRAKQALSASLEQGRALTPLDVGDPQRLLSRRLVPGAARTEGLRTTVRDGLRDMLPAFACCSETIAALRANAPDDEACVVARAESALADRFDVLGYPQLSFGSPVDWHLDPVHGRRAPRVHWRRVPYLDPAAVGDHKIVWELNRHQFLLPLAQAYAYSADERYAEGARRFLHAWMDDNPPKDGINWASSLEVAFRAMSWIWVLGLCIDSPAFDDAFVARVLAFADVHGRHLERYLSTYFAPNTHLTGEALGLLYLGRAFPVLAAAERWCRQGERILDEQRAIHVRPDGTYFEQSSQYQRYTTDIYLHGLLLGGRTDPSTERERRDTVGRLMDCLMHLTRPDGTIPLIGDDDGGRLVPLDAAPPDDVRSVLTTGAVLLGRADLAYVGHRRGAAAIWLLGPRAAGRLAALKPAVPATGSHAFPDGGFYVMRDGWGAAASQAVIDCGPHGVLSGTHAHGDLLSLTVTLRGRHLLVDSGTYTYPGPERNAFRGPAAHNVLLVDGRGAAAPSAAPFRWDATADGDVRRWVASRGIDTFVGAARGGDPLDLDAPPERTVVRLGDGPWIVADRAVGGRPRDFETVWHLAPGLQAEILAPSVVIVRDGEGAVCLLVAVGRDAAWSVGEGFVSPRYGARVAAPICRFVQRGHSSCDLRAVILPLDAGGGPWRCRVWVDGMAVATITETGGGVHVGSGAAPAELVLLVRSPGALAAPLASTSGAAGGYDSDAEVVYVACGPHVGGDRVYVSGGSFVTLPSGERVGARTAHAGGWLAWRTANGWSEADPR